MMTVISTVDHHDDVEEKKENEHGAPPPHRRRPRPPGVFERRLTFRSGVDLQTRLQLVPLNDGDCVGAKVAAYVPPPTDDGDEETSATRAAGDGDVDRSERDEAVSVPDDGDLGEPRPGVDVAPVDDLTDWVLLRVTPLSTKDRDASSTPGNVKDTPNGGDEDEMAGVPFKDGDDSSSSTDNHGNEDDGDDWRGEDFTSILIDIRKMTGPLAVTLTTPEPPSSEEDEVQQVLSNDSLQKQSSGDEDESLISKIAHNVHHLDRDEISARAAKSWTALRSAMQQHQHQRTTNGGTRDEAEAPPPTSGGSPSSWRDGIKRTWRGRRVEGDDGRRNLESGVSGSDDVECNQDFHRDDRGNRTNGTGVIIPVGSCGSKGKEDVASRASEILDDAFMHDGRGAEPSDLDVECREVGTSSGGGGRRDGANEGPMKDVSDAATSTSADGPHPDGDVVGDEEKSNGSSSSAAASAINDMVSCDSHESVSTLGSVESREGGAATTAVIKATTTLSIEEDDGTSDDRQHSDRGAAMTGDTTSPMHTSPVRKGLRNLGSTVLRSTSNFISTSEAARRAYAAAASATEAAAVARATTTATGVTDTAKKEATTNTAPSSPADDVRKGPPPLCDIYLRHDRGGGYVPANGDSAAAEAADGGEGAASIRNPLRRAAAAAAAAAARSGTRTGGGAVAAVVTNCSVLAIRRSAGEGCPPSYEFQWYRSRTPDSESSSSEAKDGDDRWSPLLGATHATYQPSAVDVGRLLRCVVFVPASSALHDDDDDDGGGGGGGGGSVRSDRGGEAGGRDSATKVVECALHRAVEADRSLFAAARRSVIRRSGKDAAVEPPAATFGNLRGRGAAKGRVFRIVIRSGAATTAREEAGKEDGRVSTTAAATTTSHVWVDQVAGSTAESLCGGLPIVGVSASVDDPSDARNFELVLPPRQTPANESEVIGGLMIEALSVDDGGGRGRKLRLAAPNRVTRESILMVLGVANFAGRPDDLSLGSVFFPDMDAAAPPLSGKDCVSDSIQEGYGTAEGEGVRRVEDDDLGNSTDGQGIASTQKTQTDVSLTTSASSTHTTTAPDSTDDKLGPSDAAAAGALETDADSEQRHKIALLEAAVAELGDRLTATRDHSSSLRKQLRDMEELMCEKDAETERLRNELEIARNQQLDTCELLEKARKETDAKDRKLVETEMEMMNGVTLMEERTAGYEARCAEYDKKVELLENEKADLASIIEDRDRKLLKLKAVHDKAKTVAIGANETEDLQNELEKSNHEISELRKTVKEMEMGNKALSDELENRIDSGREAKHRQERIELEKAELRKKVKSLEATNHRLLSERNKFEHKAESLSKEMGKVFRHGVGVNEIEKLVEERKKLLQQIQDMKDEQRYAKAETDQLRLDFEQLLEYQTKSRFGAMIVQPSGSEDSVEHRQDLKKVISNLTEYLTAKELQLETMKQVNRALNEELEVLSKKLHNTGHQ